MKKTIHMAILLLCCGLLLAACTAPKTITELDKIQYMIAHQEDFTDAIQNEGYTISIGVEEIYQERYDNGEVLVLSNDLDEEFRFYFGFDDATKYNVFSENEPEQAVTVNLYKLDPDISAAEAAERKFDVSAGISLEVGVLHNEYHSSSFEEFAARFRDENIADMKIKSVLSAEELKAFYDKGIALQETLFELYEQEIATASQQ